MAPEENFPQSGSGNGNAITPIDLKGSSHTAPALPVISKTVTQGNSMSANLPEYEEFLSPMPAEDTAGEYTAGMGNKKATYPSGTTPPPPVLPPEEEASAVDDFDSMMDVEQILLERMIGELNQFKDKVVQQDILIFEMRALLQSGKSFSNILNLDQLLDTFMAVVREKFSVINTVVLLKDDLDVSQEYFRVRAYHGLPDTYREINGYEDSMIMFRFPKNNGLLWQLVQQGTVFSVMNIKREPRFEHAWRHWNLEVLKSHVWCPLIKSGEVLGILTIGDTEDGLPLDEINYAFIQELSSIATTNIDSTLKYEKNIRILKNIQTLYDINQQIASVNDFKRLCNETLRKAVDALSAQKGNLMLYNKQTQKLEIKVVMGDIPEHIQDQINNGLIETKMFALGEGIAGECALLKRPIRVNDRHEIPQVGKHEVHCILCVPILYSNELEGIITMTNKMVTMPDGSRVVDPIGRFTEDDSALLVGLADQAAVNLHKSRLYSASITDRMTGLFNNRYFEQTFTEKLAESVKDNKPLSLAVVDIDHFKKFNDTYGHAMGDEVIRLVATCLKRSCRADTDDMAFRYGGEEMCLLMPNTQPLEALDIIETFRRTVESLEVEHGGQKVRVTISAGVSGCPSDGDNTKQVFEFADEALYASKHGGRNQCRYYNHGEKTAFNDVPEELDLR